MKRFVDLICVIIGILFLSPLLLGISLVILVTDGVPVFFLQERVGRNRKIFRLYKFRSMSVLKGADKGSFDAGNSSRVTPVGKFLRKTKLDELPQLFNVLLGDMSFVGPRPEVKKWTQVYPERWDMVLSVKPGITDNASIEYRNEEEILASSDDPERCYKEVILPEKIKLYEQYVQSHNVKMDLLIIFKTIQSLF